MLITEDNKYNHFDIILDIDDDLPEYLSFNKKFYKHMGDHDYNEIVVKRLRDIAKAEGGGE